MHGWNPYAPPETGPDRPRPTALRPLSVLIRGAAVFFEFSLLAGPIHLFPGPTSVTARVAAKALGAFLLVGAFFPFGRTDREADALNPTAEDL